MTTLVGVRRAITGSGLPGLAFAAAFRDAGAGVVDASAIGFTGTAPTFTRATAATTWGPTGLLISVSTGVARSTYTELVGAPYLGYLSEEARTNNCLWNRDFTNVAWVKTTMTAALDQAGIDGVGNTASSLLATAGNATAAQTITIAAVSRPFSVYIKRITGTGNIDLAQDGATFTNQTVASDGLYHRVTLIASQLNPALTIRLVTSGDKIAVDYAALEDAGGAAAAIVTSPILTTTTAVTRNADVLTYTATGNIDNANGSAYAEISYPGQTAQARVIGNGINSSSAALLLSAANLRFYDGTNFNASTAASVVANTITKVAVRWSGVTGVTATNGALGAPTTFDGDLGIVPNISIGTDAGGTALNGAVKNVRIWKAVLSNSQLAGL